MPLRGLDFKRSNQALARFNQFLQYDLLDQMRTDRDVAVLEVSDRLMRERQREGGEIEKNVAEFKSALSDKEAYTKAMLDFAKLPEADYLVSMARLATDPNLPPQFHDKARNAAKEYASIIIPFAQSYYNASRGIGTANDAFMALKGGGVQGLTDYMEQSGMNIRAQQVAQTQDKTLQVRREELAAEKGKGTTTKGKPYYDIIHSKINGVINYLTGVKAEVDAGADLSQMKSPEEWLNLKKLVGGELNAQNLGRALSRLSQLDTKAIRQELVPAEESEIDNAYNIYNIQAQYALNSVSEAELPPGTEIYLNPQTGERGAFVGGQWKIIRKQ